MPLYKLSPLSDLEAELKPLISNEYIRLKMQDITLKTSYGSFFIPRLPEDL